MESRFDGWKRFTDTGAIYRRWVVEKPDAKLGIEIGDRIEDRGPRSDPIFYVRAAKRKGEVIWSGNAAKSVAKYLGFRSVQIPEWRPPRCLELETLNALTEISKAIRESARAAVTLEQIRAIISTDSADKPAAKTKAVKNEHVQLKVDGQYSGGDRYRDWELLHDAPEIPALRASDRKGPAHAIAGDVIREDADNDDLTPFELRRGGARIGDPEWWQLRHLFAGVEMLAIDADDDSASKPTLPIPESAALACVRRAVARLELGSIVALEVTKPIPSVGLTPGDIVLRLRSWWTNANRLGDQAAGGSRIKRISRAHFGTLLASLDDSFRVIVYQAGDGKPRPPADGLRDVRDILNRVARNKRLLRARDASSPLVLLRDMHEAVTPIAASTDDAAIFELLCEVGGRMPRSA